MDQAQIRNRINELTKEKQEYMQTRNRYKTSLENTNKLLTNLKEMNNYVNLSIDNLKKYFTIDKTPVESKKIEKIKDSINKIIKKLNNIIIPSIKTNISNLDNKISTIEREISNLNKQY